MTSLKQHIVFKAAIFIVSLCLLTPILVKFSHVFSDHEHEICLGENQSHFHEIDMDCEFFKFKINHDSFFTIATYEIIEGFDIQVTETSYYTFLNSHQQLTSFLRGPPQHLM